jgi:hypothetical protein
MHVAGTSVDFRRARMAVLGTERAALGALLRLWATGELGLLREEKSCFAVVVSLRESSNPLRLISTKADIRDVELLVIDTSVVVKDAKLHGTPEDCLTSTTFSSS